MYVNKFKLLTVITMNYSFDCAQLFSLDTVTLIINLGNSKWTVSTNLLYKEFSDVGQRNWNNWTI